MKSFFQGLYDRYVTAPRISRDLWGRVNSRDILIQIEDTFLLHKENASFNAVFDPELIRQAMMNRLMIYAFDLSMSKNNKQQISKPTDLISFYETFRNNPVFEKIIRDAICQPISPVYFSGKDIMLGQAGDGIIDFDFMPEEARLHLVFMRHADGEVIANAITVKDQPWNEDRAVRSFSLDQDALENYFPNPRDLKALCNQVSRGHDVDAKAPVWARVHATSLMLRIPSFGA